MSATIERRFHLGTARGRGGGSRRTIEQAPPPAPAPESTEDCVHPLARRMAMAIRCQQLIDSGLVADQAALAAVAGMTRAWVTVVMRLNNLAPEIQEALLFLEPASGIDCRYVDPITRVACWAQQRALWDQTRLAI